MSCVWSGRKGSIKNNRSGYTKAADQYMEKSSCFRPMTTQMPAKSPMLCKSYPEESIQRLRKYINQLSDSDGQHCSLSLQGALWQIEKLTNELAFMKSLYDQERAESKRLEESKLQILLILASLSASVCVTLSPSYDLLTLVVGSVGAAFGSCLLLFFAYGITDALYRRHPDLYDMFEPSNKKAMAFALAAPVVVAFLYKAIILFACN